MFLLAGCSAPKTFLDIPLDDGDMAATYNIGGDDFTQAGDASFHLGQRPCQPPPDWVMQRVAHQKAVDPEKYRIAVYAQGGGRRNKHKKKNR